MSNFWFTSDTHFGHSKIIEYCNRPFSNADEMDETMIERWNSVVKPNDTVWHLGDFAFHKSQEEITALLQRLNGTKNLIAGNHDDAKTRYAAWNDVRALVELSLGNKTKVTLCHYALRVWNKSHHGALHFYGHSHGTLPGDRQSLDVGVDCWDYTPVNIEQIRERLKTQPERGKEF